MHNEIKNTIETPKQKLLNKVKEARYSFNKNNFKKFQDFFF